MRTLKVSCWVDFIIVDQMFQDVGKNRFGQFFKGSAILKQQYAFLLGKIKIHWVASLTKVMFILFLCKFLLPIWFMWKQCWASLMGLFCLAETARFFSLCKTTRLTVVSFHWIRKKEVQLLQITLGPDAPIIPPATHPAKQILSLICPVV